MLHSKMVSDMVIKASTFLSGRVGTQAIFVRELQSQGSKQWLMEPTPGTRFLWLVTYWEW
jgi:hypothetical protein